jgi:tripartite-type tricarboxylate transporter receptor subunit TctC
MAGINMVRIAYKGGGAAITALMGNEVQFTIFDAAIILPQMKAGKLRGLAVTSAEPTVLVPGLPSIASAGLPGYESVGMTGVFAQTKTPPAIINRLNREMVRVLNLPDVKEKFFSAGIEVIASSPEGLDTAMKADISRMSKAIKDAGLAVN